MNKNPIDRLVSALSRLPGIGEKSATRLALFILRDAKGLSGDLIDALTHVREKVRFCRLCQNLSEDELCPICEDPQRDRSRLCVVQEPVDVLMVEKSEEYRGLYHVLHGALSPLDGVGPEDIRAANLLQRLQDGAVSEVILATNPNPEGEATALYLRKAIAETDPRVKITRIASGVPVGGSVEYTDSKTLARALSNRRDF
ncbi:MAG TPA: recombination mediator RecR [bacterium]|nr:recombination mediator RecR [bacterium]